MKVRKANLETDINTSSGRNRQSTLCTPLNDRTPTPRGPFSYCTLPISAIPHLDGTVQASRSHIPTAELTRVNAYTRHTAKMSKKSHSGVRKIRRPESDRTILVAEVKNSVVRILSKSLARAKFGAVFGNDLAG